MYTHCEGEHGMRTMIAVLFVTNVLHGEDLRVILFLSWLVGVIRGQIASMLP